MARPAHRPDATTCKQVEAMAGYGMPEAHIAAIVGVDAKTLRKHYRSELDLGHIKANSAVAQSLFRKATGDGPQAVTAAIFWMKTRLGWKETMVTELASAHDNTPLPDTRQLARVIVGILGKAMDGQPGETGQLAALPGPGLGDSGALWQAGAG